MNKLIKRLSILVIFTLIIQNLLPISSLASQNTLDTQLENWNITRSDFENGVEFISYNQEVFLEFADEKTLKSYNISDENTALLYYYLNEGFSTESEVNTTFTTNNNEIIAQPAVLPIIIRTLVAEAVKKKMGKEIRKRIGDEVEKKVIPQMQDAAEQAVKKYNKKGHKGPENSSAPNGINQGEHILSLQDDAGDFIRFHVNLNPNKTTSTWHWHLRNDWDWDWHHGQIQITHGSLPKWGTP
ncbi:YpjP family protein [Lysinibacillus louembei]|uniref:YpjP family protein n=1 Tax=Lysinibacillus louembei TaxID=1470088 RepID=A0ABZ0S3K0_9BACI|nr:YpjP family protein [Lysinibacillus louembei]WPK13865.1 YpjP family protein [Lysinibacillus louembei]